MNIDDPSDIKTLDTQGMLAHILNLPEQLENAWKIGLQTRIREMPGIRQVLIAGMGGSAIGGDLVEAYVKPENRVPIIIHRDYGLPAWAVGDQTLVIVSSHSGNTEETLSAFDLARERKCQILALSTGGALKEKAETANIPVMLFQHTGQPRSAVGYSFGLLLAALSRLNLIPDQEHKIQATVGFLQNQMQTLIPESMVKDNPAKRVAGQIIERLPVVVGADLLAPVARRWKGQFNELAKSWSQFDILPEFDHNSLAGIERPESILERMVVLFLSAAANHEANQMRVKLTRQLMMTEGISTDIIQARGDTDLDQMWYLILFGDFTAYYLACLSGVDPTPIAAITNLKQEMQRVQTK
ncbi:MAG: bifunctional phosphoglucose/phosphomannose isomerase [Anaerolineaceae bacterium]|nr:bifunctional phosphoglucose/phosphomannose isomerase [Anaerolineaceae bacterium]MBN2678202.1 bifunctional phosphoglucose/phosphomannose isomerase [Anaerolineaceae bacterium]